MSNLGRNVEMSLRVPVQLSNQIRRQREEKSEKLDPLRRLEVERRPDGTHQQLFHDNIMVTNRRQHDNNIRDTMTTTTTTNVTDLFQSLRRLVLQPEAQDGLVQRPYPLHVSLGGGRREGPFQQVQQAVGDHAGGVFQGGGKPRLQQEGHLDTLVTGF